MSLLVYRKAIESFVYRASRSQKFLWRFVLITISIGACLGYALSQVYRSETYLFGERVLAHAGIAADYDDEDESSQIEQKPVKETPVRLLSGLREELADESIKLIDVIWAIPTLAPHIAVTDYQKIAAAILLRFNKEESDFVTTYLCAIKRDVSALSRLKEYTEQTPPFRYANYTIGMVEMKQKHYHEAYRAFLAEGERKDATESRSMAVRAILKAKDFKTLSKLSSDPRFSRYITAYVRSEIAAAERDFLGMLKWIAISQFTSYKDNTIIMTLVSGLAWAFFLIHLGEIQSLFSKTAILCGLGFFGGVISTTPTIFLVMYENDILNFPQHGDAVYTFLYDILGVGAREEICKLLLFSTLLPFLLKRNSEFEALIVGSFVGLGFAIEENGGYFMSSAAASAPGRFLTANFLHIILTGMNGLVLYRTFKNGVSGINELMIVFPMSILAHGVYDALIDVQEFNGGGLSMVVYILCAQYYFSHLHPLRSNRRMTIGLSGAFVFGLSVLAASVIAFQMATLGAGPGLTLISTELVGSAVLVGMFFREFNERLTP